MEAVANKAVTAEIIATAIATPVLMAGVVVTGIGLVTTIGFVVITGIVAIMALILAAKLTIVLSHIIGETLIKQAYKRKQQENIDYRSETSTVISNAINKINTARSPLSAPQSIPVINNVPHRAPELPQQEILQPAMPEVRAINPVPPQQNFPLVNPQRFNWLYRMFSPQPEWNLLNLFDHDQEIESFNFRRLGRF